MPHTDFRLKVFQRVAVLGSFTGAALELGISQPAVSKHIAEIENIIGDNLFVRGKDGISLTPKGEILLDYATRILHLYECMNRELVPNSHSVTTDLRIVACPLAAKFILPSIIKKFNSLYPNIRTILVERESDTIESIVKEHDADIGISEIIPSDTSDTFGISHFPFASLNLPSGKAIGELYALFCDNSPEKEAVDKFLLTAKTTS